MLMSILWMVLKTVASILVGACVLRLWIQKVRIPPANPLSQFSRAITDWLVLPLRKVVPGAGGIDWASLVGAYLICLLLSLVLFGLAGAGLMGRVPPVATMMVLALVWLADWSVFLVMGLVLVHAVLSWVNPYAPLAPAIDALTRPLLAPIRRVLPLIGNVDLSPLALLLILQVLMMVLDRVAFSLGAPL